jgi:hypothetical protein
VSGRSGQDSGKPGECPASEKTPAHQVRGLQAVSPWPPSRASHLPHEVQQRVDLLLARVPGHRVLDVAKHLPAQREGRGFRAQGGPNAPVFQTLGVLPGLPSPVGLHHLVILFEPVIELD